MVAALDLACLAVVVLAACGGALAGAASQLASVGATAAGWAGARFLAPHLVPYVQGRVPAFAAHPVASVLAFGVCAAVGALALRALGAALRDRGGATTRADRALGAVVGGAKAMLVLWVLLSALALWGRPIHLAGWDVDPRGSELVAFAGEHSALRLGRAFHGDGESKARARESGAHR
jgi:uncharacterized membrane protein required for colicin V production